MTLKKLAKVAKAEFMHAVAALMMACLGTAAFGDAPVADVMWDGDFTALSRDGYTLGNFGDGYANTVASDGSYVQIGTNNGKAGITLTRSNGDAIGYSTVIFKVENLPTADEYNRAIAAFLNAGTTYPSSDTNGSHAYIGIARSRNETFSGTDWSGAGVYIWQGEVWKWTNATYYVNEAFLPGETPMTIALSYAYDAGTATDGNSYSQGTSYYVDGEKIGEATGLRSKGYTPTGIVIGGVDVNGNGSFYPMVGMKITAIALFERKLSDAEVAEWQFPSEESAAELQEEQMLADSPASYELDGATSSGIFRIPALAKSTNNVAVALYDCRYSAGHDLPNTIDLFENWSGNRGATWTQPRIGINVENSGRLGKEYNIGDPCILYDPESNRFFAMAITGGGLGNQQGYSHTNGVSIADVVLYTRGTGKNDAWEEWTGGPAGNTRSCKQMILDSLGEIDDTATSDEDAIGGILQGPGHGIVQQKTVYADDGETVLMPAGALIFPMQYFPTYNAYRDSRTFAVYSTDGGQTWHATKLTSSSIVAQENCVMELDDGSWYMICKGNLRQLFRSTNFVDWEYVGSLSPSQWVQGSCLKLGTGTDGRGRYAACFSPAGRNDVTLYFGRDTTAVNPAGAGISWSLGSTVIYPGSTGGQGYNSLAMLDEETLGILIEADGHIYLKTENVGDILAGEDRQEHEDNLKVELDDPTLRISNTNSTADAASWTISATPHLMIPAGLRSYLEAGTQIRLSSLDFGYSEHAKGSPHADRIALKLGDETWTSALVVTNYAATFPGKNSAQLPRLVYSFEDADCILTVGLSYELALLDADGNPYTGESRYVVVKDADSIITGMEFVSNSTTWIPMFQLTGEMLDEKIDMADEIFDWTPGSDPRGSWIQTWSGDNNGSPLIFVGPDGTAESIYRTATSDWTPYQSYASSLAEFTFVTYGSADLVKASPGKYAVLWCMGRRQNQKTVLVKDDRGHICLLQVAPHNDATGVSEITRTIDAGEVKGYHLFTVRFSTTNGASLQIDDGEIHADPEFTLQTDETGFQVGAVRSGSRNPLEDGNGFAVIKMLAFDSDSLSDLQFSILLDQYPAVTTMGSLDYDSDGENLYLPSLTMASGKLSVKAGTLQIPASVEASLSSLSLGDSKNNPTFGMNLAGTLHVNTDTGIDGNDAGAAYRAMKYSNIGVVFGEWTGSGTVDITGVFDAPGTILSLCHVSDAVTTTVNGGVMRVKGVTAYKPNTASIVLANGGTIDFGEYASCANAISKTYECGTITGTAGWTDTDAIEFTCTTNYTKILADGIDLKFTGELTGAGNISINAPNGGSVEFANYQGTGVIAVQEGALRVASGTEIPGWLAVRANAALDIVTDGSPVSEVTLGAAALLIEDGAIIKVNGEQILDGMEISESAIKITPAIPEENITHECVLRISEIMPKPTDDQNPGEREGMDVNGLESGWVEVENTSDYWADLADYRFIRVNRGKKTDTEGFGNFPSRLVKPHSRAIFYTSERYSNSKDKTVSAFEHGTFDGKPMIMDEDLNSILVWGDKVNPKKSPFVRLYYAPVANASNIVSIVDTVVVPSDLPEGWSIIVGYAQEGQGVRRWLCPTPTRGEENVSTEGLVRIGPNAGPLYEAKDGKKHDSASEFARIAPPAVPGEDYTVTFSFNPVMHPTQAVAFRAEDEITSISLICRTDLDDATRIVVPVDLESGSYDAKDWGYTYTATIPASAFPAPGHLIQWKFTATDAEGTEWTSPSFNNPDDGYEWYGTIVEPDPATQMSATLPTWHMFASGNHLTQMDIDKDKQDLSKVPNYARIAIYDSSTSNYYDYVRIDLRGNTSAKFSKKGHGLRFAKVHPLNMTDVVTGEPIEDIRKTSLISEFADPSYMRQMIAFWLWRKMGNKVPFDFPVRCNLNGEFYQLAFNSERFTDELIEDVYGFDKFGYGYKNVGTLNSNGTTAGDIEKKTPDDEDESNITMLMDSLVGPLRQYGANQAHVTAENASLTKFVVEKFDLPAWLNYLASARITQEMDDVWANVCAYYDNAQMTEGVRGKGTWMPLGYDFNLSFGQFYINDIDAYSLIGLSADQDWYKSHPLYGGWTIRARVSEKGRQMNGNNGFEAVYQSEKFRRLYLRRLRTLMDAELKAPGTQEGDTPFMAKMREMADMMRADATLDTTKWPDNGTDNAIDVWKYSSRPANMDAAIDEIWSDYVVPRREHLYVTHSVTNTEWEVGYSETLNAGIPESQSPIAMLAPNISIANLSLDDGLFHDTEVVVIYNGNAEVVDMSGWRLAYGAEFTFPAGTVCDAGDYLYIVADRREYIAANKDNLTDEVIVGNATITGSGPIALFDADGYLVFSKVPETPELNSLRLHSFCGNTIGDGDTGEWFVLTNISDSVSLDLAGVVVCFLKQGDDHDTTSHCHVTLENKKGAGTMPPLGALRFNQADWAEKGWSKIQNNKQDIKIYDKYGSVCQSLKVTQKDYSLAYGNGGWLVCDSIAADVTSKQWHADTDIIATFLPGEHGTLTGDTVQRLAYGATATPPVATPDEGWEFAGWSDDVTAEIIGPTTFMAQWSLLPVVPGIDEDTLDEFYVWLKEYGQLSDDQAESGDASQTVARDIANQMLKSEPLLRGFIAGTGPLEMSDTFPTSISFDEDGNPVITPSTGTLSPEEIAKRKYTTYGKFYFEDDWTPIEGDLTTKDFRFFKVTVELQQK